MCLLLGWDCQELGIKPGSAEFHALKRGDFTFTGKPTESADTGQGKGKGRKRPKGKASASSRIFGLDF